MVAESHLLFHGRTRPDEHRSAAWLRLDKSYSPSSRWEEMHQTFQFGNVARELPPMAGDAIVSISGACDLTPREQQVLCLCCFAHKNSVIASTLRISVSAVRRHLRNLHRKTGTADKTELVLMLWHTCSHHA